MNLDFDRQHQQAMFLNEGDEKLTSIISSKKWSKYKTICQKTYSIDIDTLIDFSSFYLLSLLQYQYQVTSNPKPLDYHLWDFALGQSKVMGGLESFEEQVLIHKSIPNAFSLKMLDKALRNVSNSKSQFEQMCRYYVDGDYDKIHSMARRQMGAIRRLMIYNRNLRMTEKFISMAESTSIFASVGAAHLGGNEGIVSLLKKKGWHLKRIKL
jgi:uncharacterized protein